MATIIKSIFKAGQLVFTRGVNNAVADNAAFAKDIDIAIKKYFSCDWGELDNEDKQLNDDAVKNGDDRILARYKTCIEDIYIITEWDRSATTILFCSEY